MHEEDAIAPNAGRGVSRRRLLLGGAQIRVPDDVEAGEYRLGFDMVCEFGRWFSDESSEPMRTCPLFVVSACG